MRQLPRCDWVFLNRNTAANRKQKLVPSSDLCRPSGTSLESENSREVLAKFCLNGERWRAACQEEAIEHLWICCYSALRSFTRPAVTTLPQPSFPHQLCEEAARKSTADVPPVAKESPGRGPDGSPEGGTTMCLRGLVVSH